MISRLGAAAVVVVAVASAHSSFGRAWDLLGGFHASGAALTPLQREHAPAESVPLPPDRFDHYRSWLSPSDRYWLDVAPSGLSSHVDLPAAVAAVARFALLPAVQVTDVADATVVLSWDHDPGLLPLRYSEQHREGLQVVFVSRIAR
jgi:acyl transferase domain-containing protein